MPLMVGHRIIGKSLLDTGKIKESREHCAEAIALILLSIVRWRCVLALYDVSALRRRFGARPTCVDATQAQRPDALDLGIARQEAR
jgi:hypothetical protein